MDPGNPETFVSPVQQLVLSKAWEPLIDRKHVFSYEIIIAPKCKI
jgi:hypothetical protein